MGLFWYVLKKTTGAYGYCVWADLCCACSDRPMDLWLAFYLHIKPFD